MPDILKQYQRRKQQNDPNREQNIQAESMDEYGKEKGLFASSNVTNDEEQNQRDVNTQFSNETMGPISTINQRERFEDPTSWTPEDSDRGFMQEAGNSLMRGIGNHLIKGTGDLLQVAGGFVNKEWIDGNPVSEWLQNAGTEFSDKFQSYIPEELKHENLSWGSMMNPKFWSTHVAEMVPQLAEFVLLSKGGSAAARNLASKSLKNLPGAGKTALGKVVPNTAKGPVGALATDVGLTATGNQVFGTVGGGIAGNLFSGMLNAAEIVNRNKGLLDENDERVFSDEELQQLAAGTMKHNAAYVWADMLSWGLTFGNGWKSLKGLNPVSKGGKTWTAAQQSKIAGKMFAYEMNPILKGMSRVAKKGLSEGVEEQFQESWEEWAKQKAMADVTGEKPEYEDYWDFFASKENKPTRVLSFAVGALGGSAFNIQSLVNKKADDAYLMYDRSKNLKNIINKQGTDEQLEWQNYHIRDTMADIVADDKVDLYEDFSTGLVEKGNITEEEKAGYDELMKQFVEAKEQGEKLNVKGTKALLDNVAVESYATTKLAEFEEIAKSNIESINANPDLNERQKNKKLREIEATYKKQLDATSLMLAKARQNKANLIIGQKADPLEAKVIVDKYGNEIVTAGLSTEQFKKYTKEGEEQKPKSINYKDLSTKAKEVVDEIKTNGENLLNSLLKKDDTETLDDSTTQDDTQGENVQESEDSNAQEPQIIEDENETIPDEEFDAFMETKTLPQELIDSITDKIQNEQPLTKREEAIRQTSPNLFKSEIARKTLGLEPEEKKKPSEIDFLNKKDVESIEKQYNVSLKRTNEGYDVESNLKGKKAEALEEEVREAIAKQSKEKIDDSNQSKLTDEEKDFIKEESLKDQTGESIKKTVQTISEEATKKWRVVKKNLEDAAKKITGGGDNRKNQNFGSVNRFLAGQKRQFVQRLGLRTLLKNAPQVSQNELDNYLNTFTNLNQYGPIALDKMAVVNHNLKRMFPNTNDPAQVLVVSNLYESIGSEGLGHALGMTIYIDEKAWNQNDVFMHEMAHIYFKLSRGEKATEDLVKKALLNKELVAKIKQKYPDYLIYNQFVPGQEPEEITKGEIISKLSAAGADMNTIDTYINRLISEGDLTPLPLRDQRYLVEEMFTAQLEGPLSKNFDKVFNNINQDLKRQKDVKVWWGLLRKKGEVINQDDGVRRMLDKFYDKDEVPPGDLYSFMKGTFEAVTEGVIMDSYGLDKRADEKNEAYANEIDNIGERKSVQYNNDIDLLSSLVDIDNNQDGYENGLEQDGVSFYDKSFEVKTLAARKIMRRFGTVYNKILRQKDLLETGKDVKKRNKKAPFDMELFESVLFNLANENKTADEFIYNIENSALKEIKLYNKYLDQIYPNSKLVLLNSMFTVLSNAQSIHGFRNSIQNNKTYQMWNSLSMREKLMADTTMNMLRDHYDNQENGETWNNLRDAVERIYNKDYTNIKNDVAYIVNTITPPSFNWGKIVEQGFVTYQGLNIPIETLIAGYIQKGLVFNKNKYNKISLDKNKNKSMYFGNFRPLVESLISTNRKFTPISTITNAEGNMEPSRITNNHLTKEMNNMTEYLDQLKKSRTKKDKKELFMERYSHVNHIADTNSRNKNYKHNQFLEHIYDQYQKGIMPTVMQYHGLQDLTNDKSSLHKNSTAVEQGIEDFMSFMQTSVKADAKGEIVGKTNDYLGNIGTFADSPRKFFMRMKRIDHSEVWTPEGKLRSDGAILSSVHRIHENTFGPIPRTDFGKEFKKSVQAAVKFFNDNAEVLINKEIELTGRKTIQLKNRKQQPLLNKKGKAIYKQVPITLNMSQLFTNGKLNKEGIKYVQEYSMNATINGYNVTDVFAPGIDATNDKSNVIKRFKLNTSPVISVKNPNFYLEPIYFADEVIGTDAEGDPIINGTDSAMYILKEDAENWQRLGKGLFELNNGFKFLNASIEKDHPLFKHKTAYLKGYTTIVDETHPLYKLMKSRKDKYVKWHKDKYGASPSIDLNDGTRNHMVIAVPMSSDKSNFFKGTENVPKDFDTLFTEEALNQDFEAATKAYDKMYYTAKNFRGISGYNFGPQQLMDKNTTTANTPAQMVNSITVNATVNGKLNEAYEIQRLISLQKQQQLQNTVDQIQNSSPKEFKKLIDNGLNKEAMDQAQRLLFEDNGSVAHPYLIEIATNQLAKTMRRAGNQLRTDGTYAHQKPDSGWRTQAKENKALKGYGQYTDGATMPAEIVLPRSMQNLVKPRTLITYKTHKEAIDKASKGKKGFGRKDVLESLKDIALRRAKDRHNVSLDEAEKYIGEEYSGRTLIGYHVKGQTVIASRVPGHGPASTGVFEAIGFQASEGNQASVSGEFNHIIGSDNDGDALFIQFKSKKEKEYKYWNEAFDKMTSYWMSEDMREQITAPMLFDTKTKEVIKNVSKVYPNTDKEYLPFSPNQRMKDYDNTMVSKRNVGPVFNIHKIANNLAATNTEISRPITINNAKFDRFQDVEKGNNSRNQQSAILANIILDNSKHSFADKLGLDESNIAQATLMINLGMDLEQVGLILNTPASKKWSKLTRENNSLYHKTLSKNDLLNRLRNEFSSTKKPKLNIDLRKDHINKKDNQANVIELLNYLSQMNSEIQAISTIMAGHSKIHVNPLVLEKQIERFDNVIAGKNELKTVLINDEFKSNPDMQNYRNTAVNTLNALQAMNPVYREGTNDVLKSLTSKISNELNDSQLQNISKDVLRFQNARLLGLNNKPREYFENLMNPQSEESVYNKVKKYLNELNKKLVENKEDERLGYNMSDNSILFSQALSINLDARKPYISTNTRFVNDTFSKPLRDRAIEEFEQLPLDLRNALIAYDLIQHNWTGSKSLAPFFGKETNMRINEASNQAMVNKNTEEGDLSPAIKKQLEYAIALKQSVNKNNPYEKIFLGDENISNENVMRYVTKRNNQNEYVHKNLTQKITKGQPTYINVITKKGNRLLFEIPQYTNEDRMAINARRNMRAKTDYAFELAKQKIKQVPNTLSENNTNIDVAIIPDKNTQPPYYVRETKQGGEELDYLVEASISYEEASALLKKNSDSTQGLDAREDFWIDTYTRTQPLTRLEYNKAVEFNPLLSKNVQTGMYGQYVSEKQRANQLIQDGAINGLKSKSIEQLQEDYIKYGQLDVYAYAGIITPIIQEMARRIAYEQSELNPKINFDGNDISAFKAHLMTGSTIPSNHPASQSMARLLETEYKNFINEKKKYMQHINKVTGELYKEQLGYDEVINFHTRKGISNVFKRVKDAIFKNREDIYQRLYGPLVIREESINDKGTLVFNYKFKPQPQIEKDYSNGLVTKAQYNFYNMFKEITSTLVPRDIKSLKDYIPHTSMTKFEMLSSRGLLGLMTNARTEDQALYDVVMKVNGNPMNFKQIEDSYKILAARGFKNDVNKIKEYRILKAKAKKLLKSGKNEDGTPIILDSTFLETALGFGAINRFANNRSVKATEIPSMDLNKALSNYVHSTLFVNGNENFKGMEKLQGYIDGVLAFNEKHDLKNMNKHVKKVWKDYFLRGQRQKSVFGKKADRVIFGLTRLNLFYALGYQANKNTKGLYVIGNIMAGKYHNVKDLGGKKWIQGELRYWGLDKGFKDGYTGIMKRHKRMQRILKNMNFFDINVYDEVELEKKGGLDAIFGDLALMPMIASENWIQRVHMLGLLDQEILDQYDENGNLKEGYTGIDRSDLVRLEDRVKSSHGRGYQPTDQRAVQMYSWGTMMLQFSRFIPTMINDRFAKEDVNIYGRETIGTLRSVGKMLRYVINNPKDFKEYRANLSQEQRERLDAGLRGVAMSTILSMLTSASDTANDLYWDVNYYWNHPKLSRKMVPAPIQTTNSLINQFF